MTDWPTSLPQKLLVDGFSQQGADNLIASENDTGPAKLRRRTTSSPSLLAGSLVLTSVQKATFKTFVSDTLSGAVKAFYFPDSDGGSDLLVRINPDYNFVSLGIDWKVSFDLEVLP